jgi:hypothetical protein
MINIMHRVEKVIPTRVRKILYDELSNRLHYNSKHNVANHLYYDVFEQVRHQLMLPIQENLIILYPDKNYYYDTEEE